DREELRGHDTAAECGRRGGVPARRWLRARVRSGHGPTPAHAGWRAGASQRLGGGDPWARLRNQPDRSLPGRERTAERTPGRADTAIERRYERGFGGGEKGNRPLHRAGGGGAAAASAGIEAGARAELRRLGFF